VLLLIIFLLLRRVLLPLVRVLLLLVRSLGIVSVTLRRAGTARWCLCTSTCLGPTQLTLALLSRVLLLAPRILLLAVRAHLQVLHVVVVVVVVGAPSASV
jgi:hypothetical protein